MLNQAVILSAIRSVLMALGASLVTAGTIDEGTLTSIVGGIIALAAFLWSVFSKKKDVAVKEDLKAQVVDAKAEVKDLKAAQ